MGGRSSRIGLSGVSLLGLVALAFADRCRARSRRPTIQQAVDAAYAKYRTLKEGKNADYIPALAKVDPEPVRHRAWSPPTARSTPPAT